VMRGGALWGGGKGLGVGEGESKGGVLRGEETRQRRILLEPAGVLRRIKRGV